MPRPNREQTAGSAPKVTSALALTAREPAFARGSRRPEHPSGVSPHLSEPSLPPSLRPCREGEGGAVPPSCCERETPLAARGARGGPFQQAGRSAPSASPPSACRPLSASPRPSRPTGGSRRFSEPGVPRLPSKPRRPRSREGPGLAAAAFPPSSRLAGVRAQTRSTRGAAGPPPCEHPQRGDGARGSARRDALLRAVISVIREPCRSERF